MREHSRRGFGKGLAAIACAGLAGAVYWSTISGETEQSSQVQTAKSVLTLDGVRSGKVLPQDYLNYMFEIMPEAKEARKSGILKGIFYNPTDKKVEELVKESISSLPIADQQETLRFFSEGYKMQDKIAVVVPNVLGRRIPLYVIFSNGLLSERAVQNDADVKSIARHELQHVRDQYFGIGLAELSLTDETTRNKIRPEFLHQLQELRAVYRELNEVFRERLETGAFLVSKDFFCAKAFEYAEHWKFLENPITELEKRVRELQFDEFKGVIPEKRQDEVSLMFNLFGTTAKADFTKNK